MVSNPGDFAPVVVERTTGTLARQVSSTSTNSFILSEHTNTLPNDNVNNEAVDEDDDLSSLSDRSDLS